MLQPTPLLRLSPLDLSDLFSGSAAVLKARFGTFALITLVPVVVLMGAGTAMLVSMAALVPDLMNLRSGGQLSPVPLAGLVISAVVGVLVQPLLSLKANAMMTLGTYETAQGRVPTFGSLWRGTKGFVLRILPLLLIFLLIIVVLYLLMAVAVVGVASAAALGDSSEAASGLVVLVILVVMLVALPVAIFFSVKLIYLVPVLAIEKPSSFASLKRAWTLTTGAFWRTLGYYLVAAVAVQGLAMIVSSLVQVGMGPALSNSSRPTDLAELQAMLTVLIPAYVISMAAQSLVQIMATPFQNAYLAIMYLDQRRRIEEPSVPTTGYGWTPPPTPTAGWQQGPTPPGWTAPPPPPPPSWNPPAPPPPDNGGPGPS
ncbi:MAG: hypothetical protein CVT62_00925 [Actinobacteria bacterium HGW-Actinobacteria-2]|nr:MAG: hypothetical protein CVT62_00925 [Actinobacteria bacterium HGW-Actinobacteria-2]